MKKLITIAFTLLLGASLSFAQATGGSTDKTASTPTASGKKGSSKTKTKAHKGGKKSKKNSSGSTTPPPK
jgi:hypothetical protein